MFDAAHDAWLTEGVLGRRFVAWAIDALLISLLFVAVKLVLLVLGLLTLGLGFGLFALLPLVPFAYMLGFLGSERGRTPGQVAAGLVLRRNDDLGRPTLTQHAIWIVGLAVTLLAGAIWLAVALVSVRRRTLHDFAAGVLVTRVDTVAARTGFWSAPARQGRPFA